MSVLDRWLKQNTEIEALDVNLDAGIELFDRTFNSVTKEQLPVVGYYLERLSHLLGEHTEEWWTNWERKTTSSELEIEADFFDCYLQQSVGFDAELFIEQLPLQQQQYNRPTTAPVKIPTAELSVIIDESHAEDVPRWSKQIENYLLLHENKCTIAELIDNLSLTPGAIVCTLLLGNFQLHRHSTGDAYGKRSYHRQEKTRLEQQRDDDFYSSNSIEVRLCQHP
jgi:hypothetical protein